MAYNELIKNFNRIRDYMREFYIYGFKSRDDFRKKSGRSYDNERRRMESLLGEHMQFRQTPEGKNVFISIDSRISHHNPLYNTWKSKSFTDGDITLHFLLFDILSDPDITLSIKEITEEIDDMLSEFDNPRYFDESTVRKKLKEYIDEGIVNAEKCGRTMYYSRTADNVSYNPYCLDFFSEVAPCGVIGSYILDKNPSHEKRFAFKHHYITSALDSEILYDIFLAINEHKYVTIQSANKDRTFTKENKVVPLKVFISVQNGRQYLLAYVPRSNRIKSYRIDNIDSVKTHEICDDYERFLKILTGMQPHMWGVSTQSPSTNRMEHVDFTVTYYAHEEHIHRRLEREKRCGTVEKINEYTSRFSADVYDASELIPWIRTFICRITDINISNKKLENQFLCDLKEMYSMYGLDDETQEGGDGK